ncbi:MAG: hypothetical protein ABIP68_08945 [Ferruginibacter sp.]
MGIQFNGYSQQVSVSLNRNNILIGEQINLAIKIPVSNSTNQVNFYIPDSIPHFDIISKGDPENVPGNLSTIQKIIVFTSFDSGSYTFPSIKVDVKANGKLTELFTPSILITVGYSKEDSLGIRDLKPLRMVKVESNLWLYIIASILTLISLFLLIRYIIKKNKDGKANNNLEDYYSIAIDDLNKLETEKVESKQFHSMLSSIFRKFYSSKYDNNMLVKTTGDVLVQLKNDNIKEDVISDVATSLRLGDAVKYAKYKSLRENDITALNTIREVIIKLNAKV